MSGTETAIRLKCSAVSIPAASMKSRLAGETLAVSAHRLFGELVEFSTWPSTVLVRDAKRDRLPATEQVVVRLRLHVED